MDMHAELLDTVLLLMEEPDDGWREDVHEDGSPMLAHESSGARLILQRGNVIVLLQTVRRRSDAEPTWQAWFPKGWTWRAWRNRRRLRRAFDDLRAMLLLMPLHEAIDPFNAISTSEPSPTEETGDYFDDFMLE